MTARSTPAAAPATRSDLVASLAGIIAARRCAHPLRVAFDGIDAAGKTTLADEVATTLAGTRRPVIRASVDGFHRPRKERYADMSGRGYYERSFDCAKVVATLLAPLGPGGTRRYRRAAFDFRTDAAVDSREELASDDAILLFDGVFLMRPELRDHWDFTVFVHASFERTLARAQTRDARLLGGADAVRQRYLDRYNPGQRLYLEAERPADRADVLVDNDDIEAPILRRAP